MIVGLSGRAAFDRLSAEGRRAGRGPLRLLFRPDPDLSPRVAFAIQRTVGPAVVRNRTKRRIMAVLRDLHRDGESLPARGDHLFRVTAPLDDWSYDRLRSTMIELLSAASPIASASEAAAGSR